MIMLVFVNVLAVVDFRNVYRHKESMFFICHHKFKLKRFLTYVYAVLAMISSCVPLNECSYMSYKASLSCHAPLVLYTY